MGLETEYDDDDELAARIRAALSQFAGERSNQSIVIDNGKYMAVVAVLAIVCGLCAAISWWAVTEQHAVAIQFRDASLDTQDQYQKERNHVIELEARLKILGDEVQEIKHERR